jgi:hypothetical protein
MIRSPFLYGQGLLASQFFDESPDQWPGNPDFDFTSGEKVDLAQICCHKAASFHTFNEQTSTIFPAQRQFKFPVPLSADEVFLTALSR